MRTSCKAATLLAMVAAGTSSLAADLDRFDVKASVDVHSRWFNDADDDLNFPLFWPGAPLSGGSGDGVIDPQLHARVFDWGSEIREDYVDHIAYDNPLFGFTLADGVGVHKLPEGFMRGHLGWAPDNPLLTSLSTSTMNRGVGGAFNDFGYKYYVQTGEAHAFSGVERVPYLYREAEAAGRFNDTVEYYDGSGNSADNFRSRRYVKETWGEIKTSTPDPFAALPSAQWTNQLDLSIRDSQLPNVPVAFGVESESWLARGIARIDHEQGTQGLPYPQAPDATELYDPAIYLGRLRVECLIVPPPLRPLLTENHEVQLSMGTVFQEFGEIFPPDQVTRFDGMVGIINGDFYALGAMADLNWTFSTIPSEVPGFNILRAEVMLQTPWAFDLDVAALFPTAAELAVRLDSQQYWDTFAPIPTPGGVVLLGLGIALVAGRRDER